jgi:hypothetical protein
MMTEIPPGMQSIMAEFPLGSNGAYRGPRLLLYYPVNPEPLHDLRATTPRGG